MSTDLDRLEALVRQWRADAEMMYPLRWRAAEYESREVAAAMDKAADDLEAVIAKMRRDG